MESYEARLAGAKATFQKGLDRVEKNDEPEGQKFPCGTRVRIADDLGPMMSHFKESADATVMYVYAHAYGGENVKSYRLDIDGYGSSAWYKEDQLTAI